MDRPRPCMPLQGQEPRAARGQVPRPRAWRLTYLASLSLFNATVYRSGLVSATKEEAVQI